MTQLGGLVNLKSATWLVVMALVAGTACRSSEAKPEPAATASATVALATRSAVPARVSKIAFLDKQECCQCTRDRIDASWSALQAALAGRQPAPPITRVHVDTQPEAAAQYRSKQAFVALPAIYLLDESGNVVGLLQGEVAQAELSAALDR